jgi:hypothetical protein
MNNAPNTSALNGHVASFATSLMDAPDTSALNGYVASFATSSMDFSYSFKEFYFIFYFFYFFCM